VLCPNRGRESSDQCGASNPPRFPPPPAAGEPHGCVRQARPAPTSPGQGHRHHWASSACRRGCNVAPHEHATPITGRRGHDARQHARARGAVARRVVLELPPPSGCSRVVLRRCCSTRAATDDSAKAPFERIIAAESAHGAIQAESGGRRPNTSLVRLAGANGHDSVGGLMPLPLWPSLRTPVPAKSGRTRGCATWDGCGDDPGTDYVPDQPQLRINCDCHPITIA
jgi:hypothetical protein